MIIKKILSRSNPLIKQLFALRSSRHKGHFIIEGLSLINTALNADSVEFRSLLFTKSFFESHAGLLKSWALKGCLYVETSEDIIARLSDTVSPQGIVAEVYYRYFSLGSLGLRGLPLLVLCDGVNDPGNLGSMIRSAAAFDADAVICLPETCDVFSSKSIRASAGGIFHVPIVHCEHQEAIGFIKKQGINLVAAEPSGLGNLRDMDLKRPIAFAFGNEGHGLSQILKGAANYSLSIGINQRMESLNVAVAASIFLYECFAQRSTSATP